MIDCEVCNKCACKKCYNWWCRSGHCKDCKDCKVISEVIEEPGALSVEPGSICADGHRGGDSNGKSWFS